jgi:hypothetical protein
VLLDGLPYRRAGRAVGISKTEVGDSLDLLLGPLAALGFCQPDGTFITTLDDATGPAASHRGLLPSGPAAAGNGARWTNLLRGTSGARDGAPNPGAGDEAFAALGRDWSQPIEQRFPQDERHVNNPAGAGTAPASREGAMPSRQPQPSQPAQQAATSAVRDELGS